MSLPGGIGASDVLAACKFIYDLCMKYKAAREEFEEIAEKTKATENIIVRLDYEAATGGSIVERASQEDGGRAAKEFEEHMDGLREDLCKLQKLVKSYAAIHEEGKGRRLLWAVWESGNLTEYRRKIGYHEQKLQFWYMALVYGSLRRLETGQEKMMEGIDGLPKNLEKVINDAIKRHNDFGPLIKFLENRGLSPDIARNPTNLRLAETYLNSSKEDKCKLTDHVYRRSQETRTSDPHLSRNTRDTSYTQQRDDTWNANTFRRRGASESRPSASKPKDWGYDDGNMFFKSRGAADSPPNPPKPPKPGVWGQGGENLYFTSKGDEHPPFDPFAGGSKLHAEPSGVRRSKSARHTRKDKLVDDSGSVQIWPEVKERSKEHAKVIYHELRPGHTRRASQDKSGDDLEYVDLRRDDKKQSKEDEKVLYHELRPGHARRASDTPRLQRAKSPLIIINDDGPRDRVDTGHRKSRSNSEARRRSVDEEVPVIIVEEEVPRQSRSRAGSASSHHRGSSTSSYNRTRHRSSSGGSDVNVRQYRLVRKMDRIDSLPIDDDKK